VFDACRLQVSESGADKAEVAAAVAAVKAMQAEMPGGQVFWRESILSFLLCSMLAL
jgi:hypothetical protein